MVNQLQIAFERERMVLSPYDDVLTSQLTNYEVVKTTESGMPKFTSKDEHFVDALGLAYLAMVLEFKKLTNVIEDIKVTSKFYVTNKHIGGDNYKLQGESRAALDPNIREFYEKTDFSERKGDRQTWVKVDMNYRSSNYGRKSKSLSNFKGGRGFNRF